jgi:hypothetical protein
MSTRFGGALRVFALAMVVLATAPPRADADNLAEFIGRSDQNGSYVIHYGYLTHLRGTADADLFFDRANRSVGTARITYFATTTLDSRHVLGNIITTSAPGTLTFYVRQTPGASFGDPNSFATGTAVETLALRYFNVLTVQGANQQGQQVGVTSAVGDAENQTRRVRITATGQGTLLVNDPANFVSVFLLGGSIVEVP